ncbi:MAG: DUF948 domain-containing protein [Paenibacillaceae bacterium]
MVYEISVAVIAVGIVVFVLYMVSLMKTAKITLLQANQSLTQMQNDMVALSREAAHVMHDANLLIKDVQTKMHAFDPLLTSVSQTGEVLSQISGSIKQVSAAVSEVTEGVHRKVSDNKSRISDVVEMVKAGFKIWEKFQSVRHSYSEKSREEGVK